MSEEEITPQGARFTELLAERWTKTETEFAVALGIRVESASQNMTNWKKRGLPSRRADAGAALLRCGVDEIVSKPSIKAFPVDSLSNEVSAASIEISETITEEELIDRALELMLRKPELIDLKRSVAVGHIADQVKSIGLRSFFDPEKNPNKR